MLKNPKYLYGATDLLVPGHLNYGQFILEKLRTYEDRVALIQGSTSDQITYAEILQQSMNFAVSLTRMGVRKGDIVALISENRNEYWSALIGTICAGAVVTTLSTSYVDAELKHVFNISKPKYVICSPYTFKNHATTLRKNNLIKKIIVFGNDILPNTILFKDLAVNVTNNVKYEEFECVPVNGQIDTLYIIYSSGTTGMPKGVMLTHLNILTYCFMPVSIDPLKPMIMISPWYHSMGLVGLSVSLSLGRTVVYLTKFDIDTYLKTIEKYKIYNLSVVPPVLVAVCKSDDNYDLSSVKVVYSGAAPLQKDTIQAVYQKFPNCEAVLQGYGLSESTFAVSTYYQFDKEIARMKIGSVGQIVPGVVMKIVDPETKEVLGPNQKGEICLKGRILMKGYIGVDLKDDLDDEGFYRTGDVGYYDDDKYIFIVDRLKELIKYKGYQVPPAELESLILSHPHVKDVGVIGIPHGSAGEVPLAFVVKQPGVVVEEKDIKEFVAERLSNPKHLRGGVRFVEVIPKSATGKILRKELRKMVKAGKSKL